jgi:hypothetical protein
VAKVAYLTDIEGRWEKLLDFCAPRPGGGAPLVSYDEARGLRVADGAVLVFGGDAIDRGPAGRKIVRTLLAAKRAQPERVVLLAGNRDINKLRLARELDVRPPSGTRADLLRTIFSKTMGARDAFAHRQTELATEGRPASDEDVVDSWREDVAPDGDQTRYLEAAVLAHREGETLFVHGGVTAENLGVVPGRSVRIDGVDAWLRALNDFYAESVSAFVAGRCASNGTPLWRELLAYQAPLPGTALNQASVVYARPGDSFGNPMLPPEHVIDALRASEVRRVVIGHTPSGDCPAILRDAAGFELVLADNSYGRIERGSRVTIDGSGVLRAEGTTVLDSEEQEVVATELGGELGAERGASSSGAFIGLRDERSGRLVKARLARGDYLMFRALEGRRVEQVAATEAELARASLVVPKRRSF